MDQLIAQITQRTGISDEQARQAVETVVTFIKGKLPESLASQVDGLLGGEGSPLDSLASQLPSGLGGLFGNK